MMIRFSINGLITVVLIIAAFTWIELQFHPYYVLAALVMVGLWRYAKKDNDRRIGGKDATIYPIQRRGRGRG